MEYLKIWCSFLEVMEPLSDEERGRLFTMMLEYTKSGKMPEFKGNERFTWPIAKQAIDQMAEKAEKLQENGMKGGRPTNLMKALTTNDNQTKPTEKKARPKFVAPTVEEVGAYCKERGNSVDPEAFVAYYTGNGWKVGGKTPMKDWKAAIITWEKRESTQSQQKTKVKEVNAQQYSQRKYTEKDLSWASDELIREAMESD